MCYIWKIVEVLSPVAGLIGFIILSIELIRTNRDFLDFAESLSAETGTFDYILVSNDVTKNEINGGNIGSIGPASKKLGQKIKTGKRNTYVGMAFSALSLLAQAAFIFR